MDGGKSKHREDDHRHRHMATAVVDHHRDLQEEEGILIPTMIQTHLRVLRLKKTED